MADSLAVLTPEQLRDLVRAAVREAFGEHAAPPPAPERLLDRRDVARLLGVCVDTVDRLRREGMPELRVGDAPRYERSAVLGWLRQRSQCES